MGLTPVGRLRLEAYTLLGTLASRSTDSRTANPARHARLQSTLVLARRRFKRRINAVRAERLAGLPSVVLAASPAPDGVAGEEGRMAIRGATAARDAQEAPRVTPNASAATAARTDALTAPRTLWRGELAGVRVISLKNSKRHIWRGGKKYVVPSAAHEAFMWRAVPLLRSQAPTEPYSAPYALSLVFALKGKMDIDLDNAVTTIADLLMAAGIVADDALCVRLVADKQAGAADWNTTIQIDAA